MFAVTVGNSGVDVKEGVKVAAGSAVSVEVGVEVGEDAIVGGGCVGRVVGLGRDVGVGKTGAMIVWQAIVDNKSIMKGAMMVLCISASLLN